MLLAAHSVIADPQLAESALAHAQVSGKQGADGGAFDAIAAIALDSDSWYDDALAYATAASHQLHEDHRSCLDQLTSECDLATFRFPLVRQYDNGNSEQQHLRFSQAMVEAVAYQLKARTDPISNPIAADIPFTDQTRMLKPIAATEFGYIPSDDVSIAALRESRTYSFLVPDAHYTSISCGPRGNNVDFFATAHFINTDDGTSGFEKVLRIALLREGEV